MKEDTQAVRILHEDKNVIVCVKPAGIDSEALPRIFAEEREIEIFPVHRLDKPTGGVMVFAKTKHTAAMLGEAVQKNDVKKKYYAVLCGTPQEAEGVLDDLLFHDARTNKTYVVSRERRGVKRAVLRYRTVQTCVCGDTQVTLAEIELLTGRTHQIRVQFGSRKLPLWGDGKYGSRKNGALALFAHELVFPDPAKRGENGELLVFSALPETNKEPWNLFSLGGGI